ncbi:uncharacterized protein LOC115395466 [Salarias fasciatus]|uniref:uncharacterized protein LOC115395466 n=1 Tax=Salarias fasciatus TaxID=181472 RepID=UPI001176C760|nr:uncharacterized protein LOC115395466 [Salarias fasciatus]
MFHKTLNMTSDQDGGTVPQGLQLELSSENHSCPSSMLPSPDSNSSLSIISDIEASSSPDMLEFRRLPDNLLNTTFTQADVLCGVTMNANRTYTATAVNGSMNFWNGNLNLMSGDDGGPQNYLTFSQYSDRETFTTGAAPLSVGKDGSCRGSTENDCCSVSSGEMIVRNNSFCLDDQGPVEVSSLDEAISVTDDIGALPAEAGLPSTTLPVICENSSKGITENKHNSCLNMTFTQPLNWDCPAEENSIALSRSTVDLPTENERDLLKTFICETSASCGKEEKIAGAEAEPLPQTLGAVDVQEQSEAFNADSDTPECDKSIHSSTPVDTLVNGRPKLSSHPESPCCESLGCTKKQNATPKRCGVAGQTPLANKAKTVQIKKFPKSDFSNIKSKIITRAFHQIAAPGSTLQRKASQAEMNNEATKSGMTPAKVRKGSPVVSTKPKPVDFAANAAAPLKALSASDQQGERRGSQSDCRPAAHDQASAAPCSEATCESEQTASQHAGSDTACLEKSPARCAQNGVLTAPKKVISSKNQVRSGSALGQNKPSVIKTLLRCSSLGSSASQTPKEKRSTLKFSTGLTIPSARTRQNQTKAGNLKCSSQKELAAQAEGAETAAENPPNRIGLVEETGKSATSGASGDGTKSRFHGRTPLRPTRGPLLPQHPKPTPARLQLGSLGMIDFRTPKAGATLPPKPPSSTGKHKLQLSLGTHSAASGRPQLNGPGPSQTPTRASLLGSPRTPSWRPPRKTPGPANGPADGTRTTQGGPRLMIHSV